MVKDSSCPESAMTAEAKRLASAEKPESPWKKWGPYLS